MQQQTRGWFQCTEMMFLSCERAQSLTPLSPTLGRCGYPLRRRPGWGSTTQICGTSARHHFDPTSEVVIFNSYPHRGEPRSGAEGCSPRSIRPYIAKLEPFGRRLPLRCVKTLCYSIVAIVGVRSTRTTYINVACEIPRCTFTR